MFFPKNPEVSYDGGKRKRVYVSDMRTCGHREKMKPPYFGEVGNTIPRYCFNCGFVRACKVEEVEEE